MPVISTADIMSFEIAMGESDSVRVFANFIGLFQSLDTLCGCIKPYAEAGLKKTSLNTLSSINGPRV
jgi:hypothetical protein